MKPASTPKRSMVNNAAAKYACSAIAFPRAAPRIFPQLSADTPARGLRVPRGELRHVTALRLGSGKEQGRWNHPIQAHLTSLTMPKIKAAQTEIMSATYSIDRQTQTSMVPSFT